jgi:hypothetical protein
MVAIATPSDQLARLLPAARTGTITFYEGRDGIPDPR